MLCAAAECASRMSWLSLPGEFVRYCGQGHTHVYAGAVVVVVTTVDWFLWLPLVLDRGSA